MKKLLKEWRRYLNESEFEKQAERGEIIVSAKKLSKVFRVFHLSAKQLEKDGDFEFTPRVPRHPWQDGQGNTTEDNFTKRISLAPSIQKAEDALADLRRSYFVYAGDIKNISTDDIETVPLEIELKRCVKDLSTAENEYGEDFKFNSWRAEVGAKPNNASSPARLKPKFRKKFYACVPDASSSDELWSLKTITLYRIGEYWPPDDVELSPIGVRLIEKYKEAKRLNEKLRPCSKPPALKTKLKEVGLGKDDKGYYVYTHRARSDSYETPEKIPQSAIDFIGSTG